MCPFQRCAHIRCAEVCTFQMCKKVGVQNVHISDKQESVEMCPCRGGHATVMLSRCSAVMLRSCSAVMLSCSAVMFCHAVQ